MKFISTRQLRHLTTAYFSYIKGSFHFEQLPATTARGKAKQQKVWDRQPEPPTLTGLALHLGFDSLAEFEAYEQKGELSSELKRARLLIAAEYEKRLHQPSPTGAIFALKTLGWNEHDHPVDNDQSSKTFTINMVDTGVPIARNEKDVKL
ncbi:terminase small subunit [Mucilaginibacter boryungensis]|uniref:DNA-packaging protein gp3 n=1 Tax=Mucilaginibacter boryungensis TaxID=768480 RepID=A0ABR9XK77_9SPHI|nr:terminase small subunit [Mucilaginibacter boryungensis]MBE9667784.1 hypothetical protein [Mucilaginibacter boryungensis]